jgi:hypothetical protein
VCLRVCICMSLYRFVSVMCVPLCVGECYEVCELQLQLSGCLLGAHGFLCVSVLLGVCIWKGKSVMYVCYMKVGVCV